MPQFHGTDPDAPPVEVPIDQIRRLLIARVEKTSRRQVARDVGMSPTGLGKFLAGGDPYYKTVKRLRRWYATIGAQGVPAPTEGAAALRTLTHGLGPSERAKVAETLFDALERAHGGQYPEWLAETRERWR